MSWRQARPSWRHACQLETRLVSVVTWTQAAGDSDKLSPKLETGSSGGDKLLLSGRDKLLLPSGGRWRQARQLVTGCPLRWRQAGLPPAGVSSRQAHPTPAGDILVSWTRALRLDVLAPAGDTKLSGPAPELETGSSGADKPRLPSGAGDMLGRAEVMLLMCVTWRHASTTELCRQALSAADKLS